MIKQIKTLIILLIMATITFSHSGFSEDKSNGFYAGPLSDTPENIQKKADLKKIEDSLPSEEAIVTDVSPPVKAEPFNFKNWLRKVFSHGK